MVTRRKKTIEEVIEDLTARFTPQIRDAFLNSIQDVSDTTILRDMIEAIELGDPERAFRLLGLSEAAMRPLVAALEEVYETGGEGAGATFPDRINTTDGRAVFRFDIRNVRAEQYLRNRSSELITAIQEDTRTNVRELLARGAREGLNPRRTALDIIGRVGTNGQRQGGVVGLTPRQNMTVLNVEQDLRNLDSRYFTRRLRDKRFDRIVRRAIRDQRPLTNDDISRLVTAYKNRALRFRGERIGRTETIQALNNSANEAIRQAVDLGAVRESAVKRIWDTAADDRVRGSHRATDGQEVGLNEPFTFPDGSQVMFPGDTSLNAPADETVFCRCRVRFNIDFLEGLE